MVKVSFRHHTYWLILILAGLLNACSSSQKISARPVSLITYEVPNSTQTITQSKEYLANEDNFQTIGIQGVWAKGHFASNVTIAVVDDGIYLNNNKEFQGKTVTQHHQLKVGSDVYTYNQEHLYNGYSHGTAVASILAGNFDAFASGTIIDQDQLIDEGVAGVAFGANLVDVPFLHYQCQFFTCEIDDDYVNSVPTGFALPETYAELSRAVLTTAAEKASFVNLSFGYSTTIPFLYAIEYSEQDLKTELEPFITPIRQDEREDFEKSVFVFAAGNSYDNWDHHDNNYAIDPQLLATLPELDGDLEGLVVAAVALDQYNDRTTLSYYSNRCGIAADYCLAAPGRVKINSITLSDYETNTDGTLKAGSGTINDKYAIWQGTSFAAPIITGALGVVYSSFGGTISPMETLERLLTTADSSTCSSEICGRGIINVTAAIEPIGGLSLLYGESVYAQQNVGQAYQIVAPNGFDFLTPSSTQQVVVFDEQLAPFSVPLSAVISISHDQDRILSSGTQGLTYSAPVSLGTNSPSTWQLTRKQDHAGSFWKIQHELNQQGQVSLGIAHQVTALGSIDLPYLSSQATSSHTLSDELDQQVRLDMLTASVLNRVGQQDHTVKAGFCAGDQSCSRLGYSLVADSWTLGWDIAKVQDNTAFQTTWTGLNFDSALSAKLQTSQGAWASLAASYHLSDLISMGWQRAWVSGSQQTQSILGQTGLRANRWSGVEDVFHLAGQVQDLTLKVSLTVQEQANGAIDLSVPKSRNIKGELLYADTSIDWEHAVDSVLELSINQKQARCFKGSRCQIAAVYQILQENHDSISSQSHSFGMDFYIDY